MLVIDFDEYWRLKLLPVWVMSRYVLFDYLSSARDYYLEKPFGAGILLAKRSAEGTLLIPTKLFCSFSTFFSSFTFVYWKICSDFSNLLFELDLLTVLLKTVDCYLMITWLVDDDPFRPNATTNVFLSSISWFFVYLFTEGNVPYEKPILFLFLTFVKKSRFELIG